MYYYTEQKVRSILSQMEGREVGPVSLTVPLREGEKAWHPCQGKEVVTGPAMITYDCWWVEGITLTVH